jgi:hypothetical protein
MKSKNILLVLFGAVAVGSSALAWKEYRELIAARALAVGPQERAELQRRAWDAQKKANQLAAELAARGGADAPAAPGRPNAALGDLASGLLSRMDDPEVRRLMTIEQKAAIGRRYAAFFHSLNLPPDQLEHLKDLLLEKQNAPMDVVMAASQQGINPMENPAEFKQMVEASQAEADAKIQADLGDANYAQFQAYQKTQAQRGVVNQLQSDLSYSDAPLTGPQADQMVQILSQTAGVPAGGMGAGVNGGPGGGPAITDATIEQAQAVLAPPQLEALRAIQQQQQTNAQLQRLMLQAQGGAGQPAPAPSIPGG